MNISLKKGKRLEVCLVCVLTPVPHTVPRWSRVLILEMLPIVINQLLQLLLMKLVIFHFDSTWSYFIRQSELNGSDDVDGHNNLVISELGF